MHRGKSPFGKHPLATDKLIISITGTFAMVPLNVFRLGAIVPAEGKWIVQIIMPAVVSTPAATPVYSFELRIAHIYSGRQRLLC